MMIAEGSGKFDISSDTLRYYERIGRIPDVNRNKNEIMESFMESSKEAKLREIQNYIRERDYDYGFCRGETSHSIHPCFSISGMEKVMHEIESFHWLNDRTIYVTYKQEYTKWRNVMYRLTSSSRKKQEEYYFIHPLTNDEAAAFVNEHLKLLELERSVSFHFGDDRLQAFEKLEELYTRIKNGQRAALKSLNLPEGHETF